MECCCRTLDSANSLPCHPRHISICSRGAWRLLIDLGAHRNNRMATSRRSTTRRWGRGAAAMDRTAWTLSLTRMFCVRREAISVATCRTNVARAELHRCLNSTGFNLFWFLYNTLYDRIGLQQIESYMYSYYMSIYLSRNWFGRSFVNS